MNQKIVYGFHENLVVLFERDNCRIIYKRYWHDPDEEWDPYDALDNNLVIPLNLLPELKEGIKIALNEYKKQDNKSNKQKENLF